jgi:glycine cleavage system H protein
MEYPNYLKYTEEHEWVRIEGNVATVGITDYAQDQLGDIVFIELPEEGTEIEKGDTFGVVESTKSVSDLYVPVSGKIVSTNDPLLDSPEIVNQDPYSEGWMIRIQMSDAKEAAELMDSEAYKSYVQE